MSSSIWTRCAGRAEARRLGGRAWRVVEGQHVVSTRKLVASSEDQELLERLIDGAKPPLPDDESFVGLHYLLASPFRYPPLRHGSRFAMRTEPSLWYGSTRPRTALAETAYYRLLFLAGTAADLGTVEVELTAFRVPLRVRRGVDLTRAPFDAERSAIASPTRYDETQALGRAMREDGIEAFRYPSAREPGGVNVGAFTPRAFAARRPESAETWHCAASRTRVEFTALDPFQRRRVVFERAAFEVDGRLPEPAP